MRRRRDLQVRNIFINFNVLFFKCFLLLGTSVSPSEVVGEGGESVGGSQAVNSDASEAVEVRGEKEKGSLCFGTPVRNEEGHGDSSLEPMSLTSSGSMPALESVCHDSSGTPIFTLHDPAIARLVAEAYRLGQEGVGRGEPSLRPANSLLRSLATSLGGPIGGSEGACANPTPFATPAPPASTSTPLSAGGSGGSGGSPGAAATPSSTPPAPSPASGVAGDTISTPSKFPLRTKNKIIKCGAWLHCLS